MNETAMSASSSTASLPLIVGTGYVKGDVGTPYYVAPDVLRGGEYSHQCDVWSLGVCLFRMLCERYPFSGRTADQVFEKIRGSPPTPPSFVAEWPGGKDGKKKV